MSAELDALKAADAALDQAVMEAVQLIRDLAGKISALPLDAQAITTLASDVQAQADALAAAVAAVKAPAPAPAPAPTV